MGAYAIMVMLGFVMLVSLPTQPVNAQFVLASWDFPDEYGQGIEKIMIYENSTGSWLLFETSWYHNGTEIYAWNASVAIKLRVSTLFNETLTGAVDTTDGKRFQRHNVTVTSAGSPVFSQQNFTWAYDDDGIYPDLWLYAYDVILDFLPVGGEIYTVTIDYEIFYESLGYEGSYLHNCSDTNDMTYDSDGGLDPSDYGIGSDGSVVEIWIVPDSVADEYVRYNLDFSNFINTDGDINLTVRYKVEDSYIKFRLDLYYDDATSTSTGAQTSATWANITIDADSGKTLDYALLWCDDNPDSVTSGNRSIYVDFIEITNPSGRLAVLVDQWNTINSVTLMFIVEYSIVQVFLGNAVLIILGLIMIPVSTIYLAYGAKHDRSSNRLFYGLILFFLGCGLFIGGVLP